MEAPARTIQNARALRRRMTLPEVVLWRALRGRQLDGVRFRRQHPFGPYILDFYCVEAKLAIEVDGAGHEHPDAFAHDQKRTAWLNLRGINVLRIPARDILGNPDGVTGHISRRVRG